MSYYTEGSGRKVKYKDVAKAISLIRPDLKGKHIFQQLDALGLRREFDRGESPHGLPYSFSDYEEKEVCQS